GLSDEGFVAETPGARSRDGFHHGLLDTSSASGLARVFTLADARRRLKLAAWCLLGLAIGLSVYVVFPLLTFEDVLSRSAWRGWGQLITGRVFQNKFVEASAKTNFGQ